MSESMIGLKRSNYCGEVSEKEVGSSVTVMGWLNKKRVFPGHIFLIIRDRTGIVQVVFDEEINKELFEKSNLAKNEYVVAVTGDVRLRAEENINPAMKTGKIEIVAKELRILSEAENLPFTPADTGVKEDMRLKYRYIDLRRETMINNMVIRHKISQITRNFLSDEGFIEIETPVLNKSTPEGARDYLVPSRIFPGNFYALPQSPQIFKQLLMVSGFDRYFQIVKCFRDEDLRADRQPEFTQVDLELSFCDEEDVMDINERLVKKLFKDILNVELDEKIARMTYKEAMERFGSDKPDLRFGIELQNITDIVKGSEFGVFENAITGGGSVRAICAPSCAALPRRQIDSLVDAAKAHGAKGLAWINLNEDGTFKSTISKFFAEDKIREIAEAVGGKNGDLILICADKDQVVFDALGALRLEVAKRLELLKNDEYKVLWVTEFPLLEWNEEDNRYYAKHHPFTSPIEADLEFLDTKPADVRARAYDLVINGYEMGGGSIRIYQKEVQERMFKALGFTQEDIEERFGFMVNAFKYGAPPHGGLAFGLDRLAMIIAGADNIREVIAFPKVKDASCPLTDAPSEVEDSQLKELGLDITESITRE